MDKLRIIGGTPLHGTIRISGAKNAALPIMAAALLTSHPLRLTNVPRLTDVETLGKLLETLGATITKEDDDGAMALSIQCKMITNPHADYDLVRKMRASIVVLGPLVARHGFAEVSLPGGCVLGTRPVNYHLDGLKKLGAEIELKEGYIIAKAPNGLKGADIAFPQITVTGTENIMMAATLARGTTRLINAAKEPEVVDLAHCLIKMGAKITGAGTDTITIEGVTALHGAEHAILPDRLETGTYIMAAGITNGELVLTHTSLDLLPTVVSVLEDVGFHFEKTAKGVKVGRREKNSPLKALDMITEPYPGFPNDLQPQFMALMACAEGSSVITETIFENRFMHIAELLRMNASIQVHGLVATVRGGQSLLGAPVMATDIRGSACLVLAALAAQGETIINRIYHMDRGYENLEHKLRQCGAQIERIS